MKNKTLFYFNVLIAIAFQLQSINAQQLEKATPEQVGMDSARLNNLTQVLQSYVDNHQMSGAVALVARKNKIVYFNAVGESDIDKKRAMSTDAIFRIASQSKAIVSVGIMILQERGQLLISDPVGKYIPEFQNTNVAVPQEGGGYILEKANRPITIRDLLTHTAGIGYGQGIAADLWKEAEIQGWYFAHRNEPVLATVKRMGSLPFDAQPGEKFVYGYNTDILGAVIEVVSGVSLAQFLQENIFNLLGMSDTHFYLPKNKVDRLATVYSSVNEGIEKAPTTGTMVSQGAYVEGPRMSFSGGAGLLSTAMDYARFLQMMLNNGVYNGQRILSRKSVELMTTDHLEKAKYEWTNGTGFGLGFSIAKDLGIRGVLGTVGEFGWGGAYHSTYWVDPKEELVVVYFTQLIPATNIDDHSKLRTQIYQAIED